MPAACHLVKKVKKRPSSGQKIQNRPHNTVNASGLQLKQGRPELPIGPISVDLDTFDPIITI